MPLLEEAGAFQRVLRFEQRVNRDGRDDWDAYRAHRERLTAAIGSLPVRGGRLCLLGAGNCNDVALDALAERFVEIHLVDIDPGALERAIQRQPRTARARLHRHAPVDLSGMLRRIERTSYHEDGLVDEAAADVTGQLPTGFDVAVSCCVMTQLGWAVSQELGQGHPDFPALQRTVIGVHLRTLAALTRPGGTALVVNDLVSSETYPFDALAPDADLAALVRQLAETRACFHGSQPTVLSRWLRRDALLSAAFGPARELEPWLWQGRSGRTYLVHAIALERKR